MGSSTQFRNGPPFAGALVILLLLPVVLPSLFSPLTGHASSVFSVSVVLYFTVVCLSVCLFVCLVGCVCVFVSDLRF